MELIPIALVGLDDGITLVLQLHADDRTKKAGVVTKDVPLEDLKQSGAVSEGTDATFLRRFEEDLVQLASQLDVYGINARLLKAKENEGAELTDGVLSIYGDDGEVTRETPSTTFVSATLAELIALEKELKHCLKSVDMKRVRAAVAKASDIHFRKSRFLKDAVAHLADLETRESACLGLQDALDLPAKTPLDESIPACEAALQRGLDSGLDDEKHILMVQVAHRLAELNVQLRRVEEYNAWRKKEHLEEEKEEDKAADKDGGDSAYADDDFDEERNDDVYDDDEFDAHASASDELSAAVSPPRREDNNVDSGEATGTDPFHYLPKFSHVHHPSSFEEWLAEKKRIEGNSQTRVRQTDANEASRRTLQQRYERAIRKQKETKRSARRESKWDDSFSGAQDVLTRGEVEAMLGGFQMSSVVVGRMGPVMVTDRTATGLAPAARRPIYAQAALLGATGEPVTPSHARAGGRASATPRQVRQQQQQGVGGHGSAVPAKPASPRQKPSLTPRSGGQALRRPAYRNGAGTAPLPPVEAARPVAVEAEGEQLTPREQAQISRFNKKMAAQRKRLVMPPLGVATATIDTRFIQ